MNHLVMDHRCTINDKPRHELDVLILPAHPESRNVYQCKQTCRFMMNHISPIRLQHVAIHLPDVRLR